MQNREVNSVLVVFPSCKSMPARPCSCMLAGWLAAARRHKAQPRVFTILSERGPGKAFKTSLVVFIAPCQYIEVEQQICINKSLRTAQSDFPCLLHLLLLHPNSLSHCPINSPTTQFGASAFIGALMHKYAVRSCSLMRQGDTHSVIERVTRSIHG